MQRNIWTAIGRRQRWNDYCFSSEVRVRARVSASTKTCKRKNQSASSAGKKNEATSDESHLNWKKRSQAPTWMQRIAPSKGGKVSDLKSYEIAAILTAAAVLYYTSIVEPPKPAAKVEGEKGTRLTEIKK